MLPSIPCECPRFEFVGHMVSVARPETLHFDDLRARKAQLPVNQKSAMAMKQTGKDYSHVNPYSQSPL
eukprot:3285529-Amphidinium_carterae.1